MTNSKMYCQLENLKAAVFVDAASDCVQDMAVVEDLPDEVKTTLRGVDEVLDGVRDLLCDVQKHIDAMADNTVTGEEVGA